MTDRHDDDRGPGQTGLVMLRESDFDWAETWASAWSDLGHAAPEGLRQELERAWMQPQRHYHDLRHLRDCLAPWNAWREQCHHGGEVALAPWFHDPVYDPRASDNELKSAQWAARSLGKDGIDGDAVRRVVDLILATAHDARESRERPAPAVAASAAASSFGNRARAAAAKSGRARRALSRFLKPTDEAPTGRSDRSGFR